MEENLPLYSIEKQSFSDFSKTAHEFRSKRLTATLHHIADVVKQKMSPDMKEAKQGEMTHDRQTFSKLLH